MAQFNQNLTFCGLGTFSMSIPSTGPYFVEGKISIPTLTNGGGVSALVVTINQNGSPVYAGTAGAEGFYYDGAFTAADTLAIVFTSANAVDAGLNVIKAVISIGSGQ